MCSESTAETEPSYLTVAQLAQRLQVSESTIYGWVDRDYIRFLMAGDLVRFDSPEARTKAEAQQAEAKIKNKIYERKYGKTSASRSFAEFVRTTYLPWAKATKRSSLDDVLHAEVFYRHFGNERLSEIDHQMIEEFKLKRMKSITRYGRPRKPATVNRELAHSIVHFQDGR